MKIDVIVFAAQNKTFHLRSRIDVRDWDMSWIEEIQMNRKKINSKLLLLLKRELICLFGLSGGRSVSLYACASQRHYTDFQQMSIQWIVNIKTKYKHVPEQGTDDFICFFEWEAHYHVHSCDDAFLLTQIQQRRICEKKGCRDTGRR